MPEDATEITDHLQVHFSKLCSVQADLSQLPLEPIPKGNGVEGEFYRVRYSVVLLFNSAELKAHIRWEENGVEERYVHRFRLSFTHSSSPQDTGKCNLLRRQLRGTRITLRFPWL